MIKLKKKTLALKKKKKMKKTQANLLTSLTKGH
jgi:hypothetical protein